MRFRQSLQRKFILIASVSIVLVMGVLGYFIADRNRELLYDSLEKQGKLLAQTVASLIINELIYEKLGLVEQGGLIDNYVREIYQGKELDFLYVAVVDEKGIVLSHSDFSEYGKRYNNNFTTSALKADDILVRETVSSRTGSGILEFGAPLSIGRKHWGALLFGVSLADIEEQSRQMILQIIGLTLLLLIGGFLSIFFLSRRFLQPIVDLSHTMQTIGEDLPKHKISIRGDDEIALLGKSFNTMIDRMEQANRNMQKAHDKLLHFEKLVTLGILASSIAHKINNPLGGLFNCIRNLERQGDDADFRKKYLALIKEGLESIETTVSQLLWSAAKGRKETDSASLSDVFTTVSALLDYRLKTMEIDFSVEIDQDLKVRMPPHDLQEVFLNVLVNAIQSMPQGGVLSLETVKEKGKVRILIKDSGEGIDHDDLEHIFEMFFTTKDAGKGTGIGLWMTHELIKKWKGDISIASLKGKGTTVSITIPAENT